MVFIFFISLAICIVVNSSWLFYYSIHWFNITGATGLSVHQLMKEYQNIIYYLQIPWSPELHFWYFTSSSHGIEHFREVKQLILFNNAVLIISGIFSFWKLNQLKKRRMLFTLLTPLRIMVAIILILASFSLIDFDDVFVKFHELFFHNQYWLFDPKVDSVILMLPDRFFGLCFGLFGLILLLLILMLHIAIKQEIKKATDK